MHLHRDSTQKRWDTMSVHEQLAHVGAEAGRTLKWRRGGQQEMAQRAFARALELFDATLASRHSLPALKEIARAREVFCDCVAGDNEYHSDDISFDRYFSHFNYAARRHT